MGNYQSTHTGTQIDNKIDATYTKTEIDSLLNEYFLRIYPVGAIYMSLISTNPSILFGGTWEQIQDKFLLCAGTTYTAGSSGGEATHIITTAELPAHTHTRGTMDINGMIRCYSEYNKGNSSYDTNGVSGAFHFTTGTDTEWGSSTGLASGSNDAVRNVQFTASRNWTGATSSVGSGTAHNNMPPYLSVYVWKRTA